MFGAFIFLLIAKRETLGSRLRFASILVGFLGSILRTFSYIRSIKFLFMFGSKSLLFTSLGSGSVRSGCQEHVLLFDGSQSLFSVNSADFDVIAFYVLDSWHEIYNIKCLGRMLEM